MYGLTRLWVLVVKDEAMVSMLVEDYLEELGCELIGVTSRLEDAMDNARTLPMDAAVLDVKLAGRLNYPVAQALFARGVPVVFATGYDTEGFAGRAAKGRSSIRAVPAGAACPGAE